MEILLKPKINFTVQPATYNAMVEAERYLERAKDFMGMSDGSEIEMSSYRQIVEENKGVALGELFEIIRNVKLNTNVRMNALYYFTTIVFVLGPTNVKDVLSTLLTDIETIEEIFATLLEQMNQIQKIRMRRIISDINMNLNFFRLIGQK